MAYRKLHTSGRDVSVSADVLPLMPPKRFGLDAGSGASGVRPAVATAPPPCELLSIPPGLQQRHVDGECGAGGHARRRAVCPLGFYIAK